MNQKKSTMQKLASLFVIIFFISVTPTFAQNVISQGVDTIIQQSRDVQNFEKVIMTGGGNVYISQSSSATLKVIGKSSCVEFVQTDVSSKTLKIHTANYSTKSCELEIHVGTSILKEIQQNGGGTIKVSEGFATSDSFHCTINGGGTIEMKPLKVHSFYATIKGGGSMSINASKLLEANIRGGGVISYQGNPKVESNISGGGSVKRD